MYVLVYTYEMGDGCHRLETIVVADAAEAASTLIGKGIYPHHATMIEGNPLPYEEGDGLLEREWGKHYDIVQQESEYRDYLRLKKKYEGIERRDANSA